MKASELRIGNWINSEGIWYATDQPYAQIAGIDLKGTIALQRDNSSSFDGGNVRDIQPIPLTSEWLERFGFKVYGLNGWFEGAIKDDLAIHVNRSMQVCLYAGQYIDGEGSYLESIKYVHQLQNLYFTLTGEELTTKDDGKKEGKEQPEPEGAEGPAKGTLE